jgi:hypothetical protein
MYTKNSFKYILFMITIIKQFKYIFEYNFIKDDNPMCIHLERFREYRFYGVARLRVFISQHIVRFGWVQWTYGKYVYQSV